VTHQLWIAIAVGVALGAAIGAGIAVVRFWDCDLLKDG
jgi:hypothetical protein